ncbi:MAG: hypothetical protein E6Q36_08900 [Chryseobacterium sp.]|nr:MAG: hypothetical protein E6Q36_08900 [Chryseobacterium sp.]
MQKYKAVVAVGVLAIMVAVAGIPGPQHALYFPISIYDIGPCGYSTKKGLAYSYPANMSNQVKDALCISDGAYWRLWQYTVPRHIFQSLTYLPNIWGLPQTQSFQTWYNPDLEYDLVLIGNECDQADQCNQPPDVVASMFIDVLNTCQSCMAVAPGLASDETDGTWLLQWYYSFIDQGGDIDRIYAWDAHQYVDITHAIPEWILNQCPDDACIARTEITRRINNIYNVMPVYKPMLISEVGMCNLPNTYEWFSAVLDTLEKDDRVLAYMVFIDNNVGQPWQPCNFPIYNANNTLNSYGLAIRHATTTPQTPYP